MTHRRIAYVSILAVFGSLMFFQNCGGVSFSEVPGSDQASAGGAPNPTPPPGQTVCNSFGGNAADCSVATSLVGNLYVEPRSLLTTKTHGGYVIPAGETSIGAYLSQPSWLMGETVGGTFTPYTIVMSTIDTINNPFANGFTADDGTPVQVPDGNGGFAATSAWFALDLHGNFQIDPKTDADGEYQFAVIADDAAQIEYKPSAQSSWTMLVDDETPTSVVNPGGYLPGTQYSRMGCSSQFNNSATIITVPMTSTSAVPLRIMYYQGPIGLSFRLMYRKVPSSGANDTYCETDVNGDSSTKSTVVKSSPLLDFSKLAGEGWKDTSSLNWSNAN